MNRLRSHGRILTILALAGLAATNGAHGQQAPRGGTLPFDPAAEERALAQVKAPDNFRVTLFAAPPVVSYPTCLTTAPDGAVFVCVDPNLSLDRAKGRGRVLRLVDEDADGHADRYTVFAEMDSPRGLVVDGGTVYVMHPPTLSAYHDTDGDGVADRREELVRGLGFDLDFRGADHTTNGITLGIDGWLYIAVGDYGFRRAIGRDGVELSHRGGAVARVRTDGTGLELYAVGTRNIYDVAVDPLLRVFSRDNTNDGDGWDTRLHYTPAGADMGYPALYRNFADEHMPSLADYGAGAGTGALWVHDPGFPEGYGNTLYTADWTLGKVFRHPLRPRGASFEAEQEEFLSITRPADLAMDGRSNLYVASLIGGSFTYRGDSVGYVVRVSYPGRAAAAPFQPRDATDAQLLETLASANAEHRLHAQREMLRRGARPATLRALEQRVLAPGEIHARVAALFTLKQLAGPASHAVLLRAAEDPSLRALALRALTDRKDELRGVPVAALVRGLADGDAAVQVQAINGLVRLGARGQADAILPLTISADPVVAHLAVNALVALRASDAALRALDTGSPQARAGALRVLTRLHDESTVSALIERLERTSDPAVRNALLGALARLYNREGTWTGEWWGTKPAFAGPYFDPSAWSGSARIRPVLRDALLGARGGAYEALVEVLTRNRVVPRGAGPLLALVGRAPAEQRVEVADALLGQSEVRASILPLLARLEERGGAFPAAVTELLAAESTQTAETAGALRRAALSPSLAPELRARAVGALARVPGRAGLEAAMATLGQLMPGRSAPELEQAWRRFVGDRRNQAEVDFFVTAAGEVDEGRRVLAYAVLAQMVRAGGNRPEAKAKAAAAIEAAWSDPARAAGLARAISIMGLEADYADRLAALRRGGR